jgi:DNA-binding transcriptional MerR regulator
MKTKSAAREHLYGIGAVAKLTGLSDHTIRVWERRYGAVVAERSSSGRRVYSAADVEKLGLLKSLTDRGLSISRIAADNIESLRHRAESMGDLASRQVPACVRVAVLGDFLPGKLIAHDRPIEPIELVVSDGNLDRFTADLRREAVDVVVYEAAILDTETLERMRKFLSLSGAAAGVLVYTFGRSRDISLASSSNLVVLRAPVGVDELRAGILRAVSPRPIGVDRPQPAKSGAPAFVLEAGETIAPRRFNQQQIANLSMAQSAVECECPQHLAQLVTDLSAFEIYSAKCANRDDDDAALHRYLHQTTAQARALIEAALLQVAEAEGLSY